VAMVEWAAGIRVAWLPVSGYIAPCPRHYAFAARSDRSGAMGGCHFCEGPRTMKLIIGATLLLALMALQPAMAQSSNPTAIQAATLRKARLKI
jgi:hypothetical protein